MPLPFEWELIDPFPVDTVGSFAWSPTLQRAIIVTNADVYYSDNGIDWTIGTPPSATDAILFPVWNAAQSKFCGIIFNRAPGPNRYYGCSSVDGITWSYGGEVSTSTAHQWTSVVCSAGGRLLAIDRLGDCFRSDDAGSSWTNASADLITIDTAITRYWQASLWHPSGNVFVVLNFDGLSDIPIATSPDGVTWTGRRGFEPTYQQDWYFVATSAIGHMLGISQANGVIMESDDGITWDYLTELMTEFPSANIEVRGMIYSEDLGMFVIFNYDVVTDETVVYVSSDGGLGNWAQDTGVIPPNFDLGAAENNSWAGPYIAPELDRYFGLSGVLSLTPVVTSPLIGDGNGGDDEVIAEIEGSGGMVFSGGGDGDIVIGWQYIGSGGFVMGNGGVDTPIVLSTDVSGMYTLVAGQKFDRVYTRNVDPDDTADVAIPEPFAKTGFYGG